jgi:hypothetical protein
MEDMEENPFAVFFQELPGNATRPEAQKCLLSAISNNQSAPRLGHSIAPCSYPLKAQQFPLAKERQKQHPSGNRLLTMNSTSVTLPRQINEPSRHGDR